MCMCVCETVASASKCMISQGVADKDEMRPSEKQLLFSCVPSFFFPSPCRNRSVVLLLFFSLELTIVCLCVVSVCLI